MSPYYVPNTVLSLGVIIFFKKRRERKEKIRILSGPQQCVGLECQCCASSMSGTLPSALLSLNVFNLQDFK